MNSFFSRKLRRIEEQETSITEGVIWKGLLHFFFPIMTGTLFLQLYNSVDAVIVGKIVGKEALAACGGSPAIFISLLIGLLVGITAGAGVVVSQFYGAKDAGETARTVHTALILSLIGGIFLAVCGIAVTPTVLRFMGTPEELMDMSCSYLRILMIGMIPMFIYNMGASALRAIGDAKRPLYILITACLSNIVLDLVFVALLGWGTDGAAWATVLCQSESAVIVLILLATSKESIRFRANELTLTPHILKQIVRLGFPAGIQSTFYTLSNMIIQSSINSFGTDTIAAWAAYSKIDGIFWMIVNSVGVAATTFSGQNYGAKKYDRVRQSMHDALIIGIIFTLFCTVLFWFTGGAILTLFTSDPAVIKIGVRILHFLAPTWILYISIEVLSGVIRGAGDSFIPMVMTLTSICVLRVIWIFTAVPLHRDVLMTLGSYPLSWTITSILFWAYWKRGKWLRIQD